MTTIDKCTVTGRILAPDGTPARASVMFALTGRDHDGDDMVLPEPVTVATDGGGNLTVDLWPNARGLAGTAYIVAVFLGGSSGSHSAFRVVVPDQPTASLTDIAELVPPPGLDDARRQVVLARQARDRAIEASDAAEGHAAAARREAGEAGAAAYDAVAKAGIATAAADTATTQADIARAMADETRALHDEVMPLAGTVAVVADNIASINTVAARDADIAAVAAIAVNISTVAGIEADVTTVAGIEPDVSALAPVALDIETTAANIEAIRNVMAAAQTVTEVLASAAKLAGGNAFSGDQRIDGALGVGVAAPLMPLHVAGKAALGDSVNQTRLTSGTPGGTGRALSLIDSAAVVRVWRRATGNNAAVVELAIGDGSDNIAGAGINWWDLGLSHSPQRFIIRQRTGNVSNTYVAISATGNMAVGDLGTAGADAHASAQLEIRSATKGFLPPRMTTAQRDAIPSPAEGLVIYNLTAHEPQFWNGSAWVGLKAPEQRF